MLNKKSIFCLIVGVGLLPSCGKDEVKVSMSDDPGYAANPLIALKAQDGEKWVDGVIDNDLRTVTFMFHALDNLREVTLEAEVDPVWGKMVNPATPPLKNRAKLNRS